MSFRAPVEDIAFTLRQTGLAAAIERGLHGDLSMDLVEAVLTEAGKVADTMLAPLNAVGDKTGLKFSNGAVQTPPGWAQAYRDWCEGGWNGLAASENFGGQALPLAVATAVNEMWQSANMAFALAPLLTAGAIEALAAHGSDELKSAYLEKLISGAWTGTMNLTEPQAGSDLAALRSKAERAADGSYRITGQKIFITYGEHDMTDNIIHLVLARLPDAPSGTRGISLFLVPKFLVNEDGTLGARNDVRCHSIEHKLGIHASPTCTMVFGDQGGAVGYLVGEENRGLNCMFTMMNNARLAVATQGVGIAERAYQHALHYARDRKQGKAPGASGADMSPIIQHPDIQRMLLTMRGYTKASRAICFMTAAALDGAHHENTPEARKAAAERGALLTPIAKAFSTDIGNEMTSLGVQIHGGMGFIEETGAAQHMRDARIAAIYEGTNGIQAIDLVQRKLPLSGGDVARTLIREMRDTVDEVARTNALEFGATAERLRDAVDALDRATQFMFAALQNDSYAALAGATPYLRLFGTALGGCALAREGLVVDGAGRDGARVALARFFAEHIVPGAGGLESEIVHGAASLREAVKALA
ncbi:MAG: acyl-CoA dehydrogenase [Beijerinckiaceae bacterium]